MNDRRLIQTESMAAQSNAAADICSSVRMLYDFFQAVYSTPFM